MYIYIYSSLGGPAPQARCAENMPDPQRENLGKKERCMARDGTAPYTTARHGRKPNSWHRSNTQQNVTQHKHMYSCMCARIQITYFC